MGQVIMFRSSVDLSGKTKREICLCINKISQNIPDLERVDVEIGKNGNLFDAYFYIITKHGVYHARSIRKSLEDMVSAILEKLDWELNNWKTLKKSFDGKPMPNQHNSGGWLDHVS